MATFISRTFSGHSFECFKVNPFTGETEPFSLFVPVSDYDRAYKLAAKQVAGIGMIKLNLITSAPEHTVIDNETRRMKLEDFYRLSELVGGEDSGSGEAGDQGCDQVSDQDNLGENGLTADSEDGVTDDSEDSPDSGDFAD